MELSRGQHARTRTSTVKHDGICSRKWIVFLPPPPAVIPSLPLLERPAGLGCNSTFHSQLSIINCLKKQKNKNKTTIPLIHYICQDCNAINDLLA